MPVAALSQLMPPPSKPVETGGSWSDVEHDMATSLPQDFRDFIDLYGSGTIAGFLTVLNPFSKRPNLELRHRSAQQLDALRVLHNEFGEPTPYTIYPTPGGLLPVALTDNGDVVHWLTKGTPNAWRIVVNEARSPDYEEFAYGIVAFLEGLIQKTIHCRAFPMAVFAGDVQFRAV